MMPKLLVFPNKNLRELSHKNENEMLFTNFEIHNLSIFI